MTNQKHNPLKYTPGPWVREKDKKGYLTKIIAYSATLPSPNQGFIVAEASYWYLDVRTAESNARLIAAAPELLDACYKSLADFEDLLLLHGGILDQELALNIHGAIKALTQAIAKAEGVS